MFRRRSEPADEPAPLDVLDDKDKPGSKGRPTPKRSEQEQKRRRPITAPPRDRKEAYKQARERQRAERGKVREGMQRGEDKYLPKRDRGKARAMVRDYVDARRTFGQYLMWSMIGIFVLYPVPVPLVRMLVLFAPPFMLLVVFAEGFVLSRNVKRLAAERFPDEDTKGLGMYAGMRSMQMRRLRMPAARLKPGEKDKV